MELGDRVRPVWESEQSVQPVHPGILLIIAIDGWITDICGIVCITNVLRHAMEEAEQLSASLLSSVCLWQTVF